MVMNYSHSRDQGQRSVISKDRVDTDRRRETIAWSGTLMQLVTRKRTNHIRQGSQGGALSATQPTSSKHLRHLIQKVYISDVMSATPCLARLMFICDVGLWLPPICEAIICHCCQLICWCIFQPSSTISVSSWAAKHSQSSCQASHRCQASMWWQACYTSAGRAAGCAGYAQWHEGGGCTAPAGTEDHAWAEDETVWGLPHLSKRDGKLSTKINIKVTFVAETLKLNFSEKFFNYK